MATDYEQKYKGALERAKKFKDKYGGDYAGYIFPELAASEDERIRKKMIEHFKSKTKDTWCNMPVKSILAWLEKQKEQKPAEWSEEEKDKVAQYLHDRDGGMLWSKATEITGDILDMLRPSWKPSDEQMQAVKHAYNSFPNDCLIKSNLRLLYHDLEKLM